MMNINLTVRNIKQNQTGFTFIELILYISILTIILGALMSFALNLVGNGQKSATQQEVYSNARFISEKLKYEIRNATGINSVSSTQISLSTTTPATNPTIIDLSSGNIRIKQGVAAAINLNSASAQITSLTFANLTSADNKTKNIQFLLTVADNFSSSSQVYTDSAIFQGSAEIRSN